MALKIIASSILELFDGQVETFWAQGITVFNGIRILLDSQFNRLSSTETQIMTWLAIQREGVAVEDLQAAILPAMPLEQLLEALEYLHGRSLVIKKAGLFTQEQVVMAYTIKKLLADLQREICDRQPYLLLRYALMQPRANGSVRKSQVSTIVRPLLAMLQTDFGGQEPMILAIKQIFCQLSEDSFAAASYGAGNCLSLLQHLASDVTDLDLSGLTIR